MKVVSIEHFCFHEKKVKTCPICNGANVRKWGFQNGKQRYRCPDCFHNFSYSNNAVSKANRFVWFVKWIMERQVYRLLSRDSGMSQSSLQRLFKQYLQSPPRNLVKSKRNVHLLIDATYFTNELCLILYYDYDIQYVQLFRNTNKEKFKEIREDLENLKALGVEVYSVTCDGHKSILKAVSRVYPNAVVQRCVVHVKRQVKNYLSSRPILEQSKQLLAISNKVTAINTIQQCSDWLAKIESWYLEHEAFINQKTMNPETGRWWFTHKNLHQAYMHIANALPHLFSYLNDTEIPKTTNELEGYFTHLKEKLTLHRGLKFEAKKNFIKWYISFKNQKA